MNHVQDLRRRRHAIIALAWFGAIYFVGWIAATVVQALYHGFGLLHGHVLEHEVGDQRGYGWLGDVLVFVGTAVACALILTVWGWIGSRLPIDSEPELSRAEVEAQPFYVIDIPRVTRVLVVVGITCAVGVSICGALLFPVILVKYGW